MDPNNKVIKDQKVEIQWSHTSGTYGGSVISDEGTHALIKFDKGGCGIIHKKKINLI